MPNMPNISSASGANSIGRVAALLATSKTVQPRLTVQHAYASIAPYKPNQSAAPLPRRLASATVSVSTSVAPFVGLNAHVTIDRHLRVYAGGGANVGYSIGPSVGVSLSYDSGEAGMNTLRRKIAGAFIGAHAGVGAGVSLNLLGGKPTATLGNSAGLGVGFGFTVPLTRGRSEES